MTLSLFPLISSSLTCLQSLSLEFLRGEPSLVISPRTVCNRLFNRRQTSSCDQFTSLTHHVPLFKPPYRRTVCPSTQLEFAPRKHIHDSATDNNPRETDNPHAQEAMATRPPVRLLRKASSDTPGRAGPEALGMRYPGESEYAVGRRSIQAGRCLSRW